MIKIKSLSINDKFAMIDFKLKNTKQIISVVYICSSTRSSE